MPENLLRQVFVVDSEPVQRQLPHTLDDQTLYSLLEAMRSALPPDDTAWTEHNSSDPGVTVLQLFACLTERLMFQAPSRFDRNAKRLAFTLLSSIEHARAVRPAHIRFFPGLLLTEEDLATSVD